ncbi:MAG TPA: MGMT family protein [Longimicrobiales bacterium]|nr:MGMT family protein [Longimicrobiales bacterium]
MSVYRRIYDVVRSIPSGRVATYGQVARVAGLPGRARQVGYALAALDDRTDVPWHRVVNARGAISRRSGGPAFERIQAVLLESEGVACPGGHIDLTRHAWEPGDT